MEMLHILTVTDEEALKSLEIYLTRFKLKELELTNLFFKALKVFSYYLNYSNSKVQIVLFGIWSFFKNQIYSVFNIHHIFKTRIYSVFSCWCIF